MQGTCVEAGKEEELTWTLLSEEGKFQNNERMEERMNMDLLPL